MLSRSILLLGLCTLGCGDDSGSGLETTDAGPTTDAGVLFDAGPAADAGIDKDSGTPEDQWAAVNTILQTACAPCHTPDTTSGALNLWPESAYENIVDVDAVQAQGFKLIEPGDPKNSYLFRKLKNEQQALGGGFERMPPPGQGRMALSTDEIAVIEAWIGAGAPPSPGGD